MQKQVHWSLHFWQWLCTSKIISLLNHTEPSTNIIKASLLKVSPAAIETYLQQLCQSNICLCSIITHWETVSNESFWWQCFFSDVGRHYKHKRPISKWLWCQRDGMTNLRKYLEAPNAIVLWFHWMLVIKRTLSFRVSPKGLNLLVEIK